MNTAILASMRSKDPSTQVGACIVNEKNLVISIGYNGFVNGLSDELLSWESPEKHEYVLHAEVNAILNKNMQTLDGCVLYSTLFPCNNCAKIIVQSGIKKILYLNYREDIASIKIFEMTGIIYEKLALKHKIILSDISK
jgi:dCMP deaminase